MILHVHEQVLETAFQIASGRPRWTFTPQEIVRALPHLNESSVRTHVVSRCCENAPKNHLHKWDYFRRVDRGVYQVQPAYRKGRPARGSGARAGDAPAPRSGRLRRDTIHVIVHQDQAVYVAEGLELALVTQGETLDQLVDNVRQAVALHIEGEDLETLGLAEHPRIQLIYDTHLVS